MSVVETEALFSGVLEGLDDDVEVSVWFDICVLPDDDSVFDEKALSTGEADTHFGDSESVHYFSIGICYEREGEFLLLFECFLRGGTIDADTDDLEAEGLQGGPVVPQGAALLGAPGGGGLGIEIDEGGPFFVGGREVVGQAVFIHAERGGSCGSVFNGICMCRG